MQRMEITRNSGFDFLRYLCAFLVICIHTEFVGKEYVMLLARTAVPIFFMITGYFYTSVSQKGRCGHQIKKILKIALLSNFLYFIWYLITSEDMQTSFRSLLVPEIWIRNLLTNENPFRAHLWYLSALLYVLLIALLMRKAAVRKKCYILIPVLLGMNLIIGNYSNVFFGRTIPIYCSRNFLFVGLPCFLLGDALYQYRDRKRQKNAVLWAILIGSLMISFLEVSLLTRYGMFKNQELTFGNIISAYAIFCLVRNNPEAFHNRFGESVAWMGKNLSLGMYILHVIIRTFTLKAMEYAGYFLPYVAIIGHYGMPLIMLAVDTGVVLVLYVLLKRIKRKM